MSSTTTYPTSTTRPRNGLLIAGVATPALFLATVLVGLAGGRTSGSASASGLELGPLGWLMSLLFIATGASILAFAVGQYRALSPASRVGTALLGITGITVMASGIFTPDAPGAAETAHGQAHNMLFLVTMLSLVIGFTFNGVKLRRNGFRGALAHSIASTVALPLLVGVFVTIASDPHDPLYAIGGIIEFGIIAVGFGWISINAARILRAARAAG